ncbi:hypothetical protein [Microcoleus sp. A006_D1]|uniref:hypothetical protein n=1 Tax=Microcoleus sp. A006_D1 TaxID=3055267 RepID=UPI002FD18BFB
MFTSYAVGQSAIPRSVGYPPQAEGSQFKILILAFRSRSIDIPQDGQYSHRPCHSSGISHQAYKFRRDRRHSKAAIPKMPLSWFGNKF